MWKSSRDGTRHPRLLQRGPRARQTPYRLVGSSFCAPKNSLTGICPLHPHQSWTSVVELGFTPVFIFTVRVYKVTLIDPVELHIQQAMESGVVDASVGDARHLQLEDDAADVALLLGPLYHLTDENDRVGALREAPGHKIGRGTHRRLHLPFCLYLRWLGPSLSRRSRLREDCGEPTWPWDSIAIPHTEVDGSRPPTFIDPMSSPRRSLTQDDRMSVVAVERPGLFADVHFWLESAERQEVLLRAIRRVESEVSILGASPHLLAIARNN